MKINTFIVVLILASVALAQDKPVRFELSGIVTGSDEISVTRGNTGVQVSGHETLSQGSMTVNFQYQAAVDKNCSFQDYRLDVKVADQAQTVTAKREGEQIKMVATRGGQSQEKAVPFGPAVFLLDNTIVGDFQVIADCASKLNGEDVTFLVPQSLAAVPGKVTAAGDDSGTWNGKPLRLRKYSVTIATAHVSLYADATTHELMRVVNEDQNFSATREGFTPAQKAVAQSGPVNWVEREIKFPSAELQFPGTICLPKAVRGKVPLVVLVHGSGPHDRDETIGPNKPFAEIAHALAEAGIATLRYDKRTYAFALQSQAKIGTFTLDQEVTDDAVAGLTFAATQPEIDSAKLFVLGHSLGGTMVPYIAEKYPKLRGMILMAAPARPIDQISTDQLRFQLKHEGKSDAEIAAAMKKQAEAYDQYRKAPAEQVLNGVPAGYMRDWLSRDPAKLLRSSTIPALVLQGGSDLQVSIADYDLLKAAIAGKPHSAARLFPDLTHIFSVAPPNQTFEDIKKATHVEAEVTKALAEWIRNLS